MYLRSTLSLVFSKYILAAHSCENRLYRCTYMYMCMYIYNIRHKNDEALCVCFA